MSTQGAGRDGSTPEPDGADRVQGEVVDDAASAAFGGYAKSAAKPAAEPAGQSAGQFAGQFAADNQRPASGGSFGFPMGAMGGTGMSLGGAFRMLTDASPEVRSMLAVPLRLLTIAVALPSVIALLFGIGIDGAPRWVAFAVALLGAIAVVPLERRRRRLIIGRPAAGRQPAGGTNTGRRLGITGLIGFGVLMMMLAIGFDLLALLLVIFGVW